MIAGNMANNGMNVALLDWDSRSPYFGENNKEELCHGTRCNSWCKYRGIACSL
jgi:hypothetical protein